MRWTSQASACLVAVVLAGCNGGRDNRNDGTAGNGSETGSMSDTSGMSGSMGGSDTTGMGGMSADTARSSGGARTTPKRGSEVTFGTPSGDQTHDAGVRACTRHRRRQRLLELDLPAVQHNLLHIQVAGLEACPGVAQVEQPHPLEHRIEA